MSKLAIALRNYALFTAAYLLLILVLPANKVAMHNYGLSSATYHMLMLVVILPLIGIWFGAFYSYARLRQYSDAIVDAPEGKDFSKLAHGFSVLAIGSAASAILALILNTIGNSSTGFYPAAVIINNYTGIIVPLIAFSLISVGTRSLNLRNNISNGGTGSKLLVFIFMIFGVLYCYITFSHLHLGSAASTNNPYYLPVWLMIATIIVPSLYTWFIGILAAYEMYLYSKHIQGLFYQHAMRLLSYGVIAVITSSIVVQYFHTATPRTGHLPLSSALMIVYLALVFMALGYVLLSLGARQLRKIEEV